MGDQRLHVIVAFLFNHSFLEVRGKFAEAAADPTHPDVDFTDILNVLQDAHDLSGVLGIYMCHCLLLLLSYFGRLVDIARRNGEHDREPHSDALQVACAKVPGGNWLAKALSTFPNGTMVSIVSACETVVIGGYCNIYCGLTL